MNLLNDPTSFTKQIDGWMPIVGQKARLLLERIATFRPRLAQYIIETRNTQPVFNHPLTDECAKPVDPSDYK